LLCTELQTEHCLHAGGAQRCRYFGSKLALRKCNALPQFWLNMVFGENST